MKHSNEWAIGLTTTFHSFIHFVSCLFLLHFHRGKNRNTFYGNYLLFGECVNSNLRNKTIIIVEKCTLCTHTQAFIFTNDEKNSR